MAIVMSALVWILVLSLLSQAISALVKWRVVASGAIIGVFFLPFAFGEFMNQLFITRKASLLSLMAVVVDVTEGLFGTLNVVSETRRYRDFDGNIQEILLLEPPLFLCWAVIFLVCIVCLWILARKVKAYEVVK